MRAIVQSRLENQSKWRRYRESFIFGTIIFSLALWKRCYNAPNLRSPTNMLEHARWTTPSGSVLQLISGVFVACYIEIDGDDDEGCVVDENEIQSEWNNLPDLLLEEIFSYLNLGERYYASLTCKVSILL